MNKNYTEADLILYLYDELNFEERKNLEKEIEKDPALREELLEMEKIHSHLNCLKKNPHPTSIEIVLESSESAKSLETY